MTDEQIIKALECCAKRGFTLCEECPCYGNNTCTDDLDEHLLDLINRQKAEIEILIRKKETLRDELAEKDAEIERLKRANKNLAKEIYTSTKN